MDHSSTPITAASRGRSAASHCGVETLRHERRAAGGDVTALADRARQPARGRRAPHQHTESVLFGHGQDMGLILRRRIEQPWRHVHIVLSTLFIVLGCIAYIALMVNLPFLL